VPLISLAVILTDELWVKRHSNELEPVESVAATPEIILRP